MSTLKVRRCAYALGAEITGVDASKPLDDAAVAAIREAWLEHIVVYLPGQDLRPAQFRQFCASFGELDVDNIRPLPRLSNLPDVVVRANQHATVNGEEKAKSPPADKWHSDFSHMLAPSTITFMLGKELPSVGGDTMFANMYRAYETLSPAFQKMIDPLWAVHDVQRGGRYGPGTPEEQAKIKLLNPPVLHPFVRVHPETGRKALFVAERIRNLVGMTAEETQPLVSFLMQHATRYEFVYRHRWTVNDLILWDNRCSLHYAVQDYAAEMRMMLRCSLVAPVSGRLATEDAAAESAMAGTTA